MPRRDGDSVVYIVFSQQEMAILDAIREGEERTQGRPLSRSQVCREAVAAMADEAGIELADLVFEPREDEHRKRRRRPFGCGDGRAS